MSDDDLKKYNEIIERNLTNAEKIRRRRTEARKEPFKATCLEDIKMIVRKFSSKDGENIHRDRLIEGFDILKSRKEMVQKIKSESNDVDFGGFKPPTMEEAGNPGGWIDNLVKWDMGGTIEDLKIVWYLDDKKYEYDPYSEILEEC